MKAEQHYRLNEPNVIQEVIDGEAIIADLGRGLYFSLDGFGSRIWNALVNGCSVGDISQVCSTRISVEAEQDVQRLLDHLLEEQLIVPAGAGAATVDAASFFEGYAEGYAPPQLAKYTDMEQLLMLDPIHEVDETGWPNQPEASQADG